MLIAISEIVATGCAPPYSRGLTMRERSPASSGHRKPTAAGRMHSVQIGRPHRVQRTSVSRSGCR